MHVFDEFYVETGGLTEKVEQIIKLNQFDITIRSSWTCSEVDTVNVWFRSSSFRVTIESSKA